MDIELLLYVVLNVCNKHLRFGQNGISFRYWNSDKEIVLVLWGAIKTNIKLLDQINSELYQTLGSRVHFGLGSIKIFPSGLPHSYSEACFALKQANVLHPAKWIHTDYSLFVLQTVILDVNSFLEALQWSLRSQNIKKWHQTIHLWFDTIHPLKYISWEQLKLWEHAFQTARIHWLQICPEKTHAYLNILERTSLRIPFNQEGTLIIEQWSKQWMSRFSEIFQYLNQDANIRQHIIYQVEQYISNHYPHNITLHSISERFSLSREYISRRFKKEFKLNFSDYLTRVRLEKAKQLLVYTQLRSLQIAKIVGYKDDKYFRKVFNNKIGISTNDYRKKFKELSPSP